MNVENTQAQMRKGILEYCILAILNKREAYPSEILEEMMRIMRDQHKYSATYPFKFEVAQSGN